MNIADGLAEIATRLPNTDLRWSPRSPADGAGNPSGFAGWDDYVLLGRRAVNATRFVDVRYQVSVRDRGQPSEEIRVQGLPLDDAPETDQAKLDRLLAAEAASRVAAGTLLHAAAVDEGPYSLSRRVSVVLANGNQGTFLAKLNQAGDGVDFQVLS